MHGGIARKEIFLTKRLRKFWENVFFINEVATVAQDLEPF
jgi:hypothetical protein